MTQSKTITPSYDRRIPLKRAFVMNEEVEDFVKGCSPGCNLTAREVEENLSVGYPIIPGTLHFKADEWTDQENTALFTVRLTGGGSILGQVTVKTLVEEKKLTAYSDIKIINLKDHPVALLPRTPRSGRESVVARLLGQRP